MVRFDFFLCIILNNFFEIGLVVIWVWVLKLSWFFGVVGVLCIFIDGWNLFVDKKVCIFVVIFWLIFFLVNNILRILGSVNRLWSFIFCVCSIFFLFWKWFSNIIVFEMCNVIDVSVLIVFKIFELFVIIFLMIKYLFFGVNIFFINCFVL